MLWLFVHDALVMNPCPCASLWHVTKRKAEQPDGDAGKQCEISHKFFPILSVIFVVGLQQKCPDHKLPSEGLTAGSNWEVTLPFQLHTESTNLCF